MHMVVLYTVWYNFIRIHKTLPVVTPAMEAGLSDTVWDMEDLVRIMDQRGPKARPALPLQKSQFKLMHYPDARRYRCDGAAPDLQPGRLAGFPLRMPPRSCNAGTGETSQPPPGFRSV